MQIDPICGRQVPDVKETQSVELKRRRYYFCSTRCREQFERRAERARMNHLARIGALLTNGKVRWGLA
ncbi:MAG: YHS domain-containing protein [Myxococcales bacterium]